MKMIFYIDILGDKARLELMEVIKIIGKFRILRLLKLFCYINH